MNIKFNYGNKIVQASFRQLTKAPKLHKNMFTKLSKVLSSYNLENGESATKILEQETKIEMVQKIKELKDLLGEDEKQTIFTTLEEAYGGKSDILTHQDMNVALDYQAFLHPISSKMFAMLRTNSFSKPFQYIRNTGMMCLFCFSKRHATDDPNLDQTKNDTTSSRAKRKTFTFVLLYLHVIFSLLYICV